MPEMGFEPRTTNDKSQLSENWHPAMLIAIQDEPTPETWQMFKASPRLWRWHFAVWEVPQAIQQTSPERQSAPTSQKFSPGGKVQASKAYVWTCKLLGRQIQPGERVNLDPLMPLPCEVLISRRDKLGQMIEYANITDLRPWPDGQQYVTDGMKQALAALGQETPAPPQATPQQPVYQAPQPTRPPALAAWGQPATALPPAGTLAPKTRQLGGHRAMAVRARLTLEPDGAVCLTSGYDRQFVDDLKHAIPWDGRSWNADRKVWIITSLYAPDLVEFLQQAGAQVQDDREAGTGNAVAVPAMPADLRKAFDTLTLAYTAPLGLANVAFKFYARFSDHDDAGGSVDFRQMNDAIQTIRKYLDPKEPEERDENDDIPF